MSSILNARGFVKPFICAECKQPCDYMTGDDGIGSYEYWGQKGFDSRPYAASDCCEADLLDPDTMQPTEPEHEPPDPPEKDYDYDEL